VARRQNAVAGALPLRAAAPGTAPDADHPDANLEDVMR